MATWTVQSITSASWDSVNYSTYCYTFPDTTQANYERFIVSVLFQDESSNTKTMLYNLFSTPNVLGLVTLDANSYSTSGSKTPNLTFTINFTVGSDTYTGTASSPVSILVAQNNLTEVTQLRNTLLARIGDVLTDPINNNGKIDIQSITTTWTSGTYYGSMLNNEDAPNIDITIDSIASDVDPELPLTIADIGSHSVEVVIYSNIDLSPVTNFTLNYVVNVVNASKGFLISKQPKKVSYIHGEAIDFSGIELSFLSDNGTYIYKATTYSSNAELSADGFLAKWVFDSSSVTTAVYGKGDIALTLNDADYTGGITLTSSNEIDITVTRTLSSVAINTTLSTNKTSYQIGEILDFTGLVLTATFNDGGTEELYSGFQFGVPYGYVMTVADAQTGTKTVNVRYSSGGIMRSVNLVLTITATKVLTVTSTSAQTLYDIGDAYDSTGLVLVIEYSSVLDTNPQVAYTGAFTTDYDSHTFTSSDYGEKLVTVTVGSVTATYSIYVSQLSSITLDGYDAQFEQGEAFSFNGNVIGHYTYKEDEIIPIASCTLSPVDGTMLSTLGTFYATVSYGGKTATYAYEVVSELVYLNDGIAFGYKLSAPTGALALINALFTNSPKKGPFSWYATLAGGTVLLNNRIETPYNFKYKLNEELDSASINFVSATLSSKLPNMIKFALLHDATISNYVPTYDADGRPTNFDQYYIVAGSCTKKPNQTVYHHSYQLIEPTYVMRYAQMETRCVTNMTSITVTDAVTKATKTYTQDATDLLSITELCLKSAGVKTSSEDTTWFAKVQIMDEDLLQSNGVGINDSFVEQSLYDALFKIGKIIQRYPVLVFNKDFLAGQSSAYYEANPSQKEFLLFFERYDGVDKTAITMATFLTGSKGYTEAQIAQKDAESIVCNAENVIGTKPIWYPGNGGWFCLTNKAGTIANYAVETADLTLKVVQPIQKVNELRILCFYDDEWNNGSISGYSAQIITVPCVEEKEWLMLASEDRDRTMYFQEGKTEILNFVRWKTINFTYNDTDDNPITEIRIYGYAFSVNYEPRMNAQIVKNNSNNLQERFNQVDNQLDSDTFGSYLENYSKENSGCSLVNAKYHATYSSIYKPGTVIEDSDDQWIISTVTSTFTNSGWQVSYEANRNNVKRSEKVDSGSFKDNKIIPTDKSYYRFSALNEKPIKVLISCDPTNPGTFDTDDFKYLTGDGYNQMLVNFTGASTRTYVPVLGFVHVQMTTNEPDKYIRVPFSLAQSGNSLLYNVALTDSKWLPIAGGSFHDQRGTTQYAQNRQAKYTDAFGKIKQLDFMLSNTDGNTYENNVGVIFQDSNQLPNDPGVIAYTALRDGTEDFVENYTLSNGAEYATAKAYKSVQVENYAYDKQTQEILNISFSIDFKSYNYKTIVNPSFVKELGLYQVYSTQQTYSVVAIPKAEALGPNETFTITGAWADGLVTMTGGNYSGTVTMTVTWQFTPDFTESEQYQLCLMNGGNLLISTMVDADDITVTNNVSTFYMHFINN